MESFLFLALKKWPTQNVVIKHEINWTKSNKNPIDLLQKNPIPTLPITNIGPGLFVNINNLLPSYLLILFSNRRLVTILAPTGYPENKPIINGYEAILGKLKILSITMPNLDVINGIRKVYDNNSTTIKNGNKLGKTVLINNSKELFIIITLLEEKVINPIANISISIVII